MLSSCLKPETEIEVTKLIKLLKQKPATPVAVCDQQYYGKWVQHLNSRVYVLKYGIYATINNKLLMSHLS